MEEYELPIGRIRHRAAYRTVTPKGTHAKPPVGTQNARRHYETSYALVLVSDFYGTPFAQR